MSREKTKKASKNFEKAKNLPDVLKCGVLKHYSLPTHLGQLHLTRSLSTHFSFSFYLLHGVAAHASILPSTSQNQQKYENKSVMAMGEKSSEEQKNLLRIKDVWYM